MSKRKAGLHKDITAIFDGVPVHRPAETSDSTLPPAQQQLKPTFSRLPILEKQRPKQQEQQAPVEKPEQQQQPEKTKAKYNSLKSRLQIWQTALQQLQTKLFAKKQGQGNSKQKAMALLVPVLVVIFIFMLSKAFKSSSTTNQTGTAGFGPATAAAAVNSKNEFNWQTPPLWPETLRDPMQFGPRINTPKNELVVRGIVFSQDSPSAVVGTKIVRPGDTIGGAKVLKINRNSVEFEMEGHRWEQEVQQ
jgi:hypothetical protein